MEVNAELYEFLKDNETGMMLENDNLIVYVHVDFFRLNDFVEIVGDAWFDEGGMMEVILFRESLCIELNDIIEREGHSVVSYKKCFDEFDLERYEKELLVMSQFDKNAT